MRCFAPHERCVPTAACSDRRLRAPRRGRALKGDILVSCDGLARSHGARVLFEGVSFGVFEGDRVGLVGPNGSGKSTLLGIVAGLEPPDAGKVSRRRMLRVGYVPQSPEIPEDRSAQQVVSEGLVGLGLSEHEVMGRAATWLGRAGLTSPEQPADTLSGGWRKRLILAREL